jgi:hypothetical protein
MEELEFSGHARQMMEERDIREEWVRQAVSNPDVSDTGEDARGAVTYYWKRVEGMNGRVLKVTVNPGATPLRVVTVHPDRAMKREMKRKGTL